MTPNEFCYRVRRKTKLNKSDAPNSVIIDSLNSMVQDLSKYVADYYATKDSGTITAGSSALTLQSDFKRLLALNIGSNVYNGIARQDQRYYTSSAYVYWYIDNGLIISPEITSDTAYELYYTRIPTDISAMTDSIDFPSSLHNALVDIVASDIAQELTNNLVKREMAAINSVKTWMNSFPRDNTIKSWVTDENASTFPV